MIFRYKNLFLAVLFCISYSIVNAQIFWTETFTNGCASLCTTFTGVNGAWTITSTGTNGAKANTWFFSCAENGNAAGQCGSGCSGSDASMHVGSTPNSGLCFLVCPTGDCGAAYADCSGTTTNKRGESPIINCSGKSNITVSFNYIERGQGVNDNATLWYYDGTIWSQLIDLAKTSTSAGCGSQGYWTNYSQLLPASANNNPNVKIGFNWTNNTDGNAADPSFAVDDITLTSPTGTAPTSSFTISDNTICPGSCITFNDQSTNTPTNWSWTFAGGNPSSSTSQNPGTVCFAAAGLYTVTLTATNSSGSNSSTQTVTVYNTPSPNAGNDVAICSGTSTTLGASGGITYLWSPATGLNNATAASPIASPTTSTTYTVTATNTEGCTSSDVVIVTVNPLPSVTVTPPTYSLCKGQGIQLTANGASAYIWSPSAGLSGTSGSAVFANPNNSTTYTVTGTNSFGCTASVTAAITVQDQPFVIAGITNDSPCPGSGAIALTIIGTPPYLFNWSTGATTQNISNLVAGNYTVTVTAGPCTVVTTYTVSPGTYNPTLTVSNLYSCSARLNWTATPTASYYKVRYKISGTSTWSAAVNVGAALFYDFTGLASNTLYNFQVAAFCASNQNLGWKVKNGKTQICTAPINPTVTALTNISATIIWTTACSPLSFLLQYRKTGTTAWTNFTTTNSYATINNLVNATEYEYRVRSNCSTGINSAFTALTTFTTAPRLEDTEVENTFHLFPNPNTGSFTLQIPSLKIESQISIYNITGQLIYHSDLAATENASSLTITLDNVADGLYEVVLNNQQQTLTQRLIIQK